MNFPNLKCLDLTNNNLVDIEKTALLLVKFKKLKILNTRLNPICLLASYKDTIYEELMNLEHFDALDVLAEKKAEDEARKEAELAKRREQEEGEDAGLDSGRGKGAKAGKKGTTAKKASPEKKVPKI